MSLKIQNELSYQFCFEKLNFFANQLPTIRLGEDLVCNNQINFFFYISYYTVQVNKHDATAASNNTSESLIIERKKKKHCILKVIICFSFTFPPSEVFGASRIRFHGISSYSLNISNTAKKK